MSLGHWYGGPHRATCKNLQQESLVRLGDDATGDARRSSAARGPRDGMNHVSRAIGGDDQRKIGNIAGRMVAMRMAFSGKVIAGGFEVRRLAQRVLMDVDRMLTGRKILGVESNFHAARGRREQRGADDLVLSVDEIHGDR